MTGVPNRVILNVSAHKQASQRSAGYRTCFQLKREFPFSAASTISSPCADFSDCFDFSYFLGASMSLSKSKEYVTVATKKRKLLHMSKQGRTETTGVKKQQQQITLHQYLRSRFKNFFVIINTTILKLL